MAKVEISQEDKDSLSELCNLAFGAAANKLNVKFGRTVKLMHPQVQEADTDRLPELLREKHYVQRCKSGTFHRGGVLFILPLDSVEKLLQFMLEKEVDLSDLEQEKESLEIVNGLIHEIKTAADNTLDTAIGKEVAFDVGKSGFFDINGLELLPEYSEGMVEVRLKFIIEDVLDTIFYCFFPVGFAVNLNQTFIQAVNIQVSEFVPTWEAEDQVDVARLRQLILYCQQIGNFALIADIQSQVKVCLASKKMRMRQIWELNPGALMEFKQDARDPVNVIFGNKVIAIADVISIGDKFGFKVKEVRR